VDRSERQHANDHSGVQNRPKRRKFNVRRAVKRVNTDLDEFVDDNIDMSDADFDNMFMGNGEQFGQLHNH
jgi:hypothetical protein